MSANNQLFEGPSGETRTRLEAFIEKFEAAWQRGERPKIEDYLPAVSGERQTVLVELVNADLEYRRKTGENAGLEEYLMLYPELDYQGLVVSLASTRPENPITDAGKDSGTRDSRPIRKAEPVRGEVNYSPIEFHDNGGQGEVWRFQDDRLHREVAVKRLQDELSSDPECRQRFLLEAEITARLQHPGVVPVHSLVEDREGKPCYTMRFVTGESLDDAVKAYHKDSAQQQPLAERSLAFRQLLSRFISVCNTIAYAHSRGILHRDLKPANIMLGKYGETLVVDWGLARRFERDEVTRLSGEASITAAHAAGMEQTRVGVVKGTIAYMSPEQAMGRWNAIGPASDIFALGATLYAILTGQAPYKGARTLDKAERCEYPPPREVNQEVSPPLEAICLKAMSIRPEDRYENALELAADIEQWLADEPVSAYREPSHARLNRWQRRHRTLVSSLIVGLAALAVLAGAVAVQKDYAAHELALQTKETENQRILAEAREQAALKAHEAAQSAGRKAAQNANQAQQNANRARIAEEQAQDALEEAKQQRSEAIGAAQREAEAARETRRVNEELKKTLATSRQRLALNYLAYGRLCALAAKLANSTTWQGSTLSRNQFRRLEEWLAVVPDVGIQPALARFDATLEEWEGGSPPVLLKQRALDLSLACRKSWLGAIDEEFPQIGSRLRAELYTCACTVTELLARAPRAEDVRAARQEFWELYWGELALVENTHVKRAMVAIGKRLEAWRSGPAPRELAKLTEDLRLACAEDPRAGDLGGAKRYYPPLGRSSTGNERWRARGEGPRNASKSTKTSKPSSPTMPRG